jgi:23S rRNA pseudoU1915 N3-methylase RlmH
MANGIAAWTKRLEDGTKLIELTKNGKENTSMAEQLALVNSKAKLAESIEKALVYGDLKDLSPEGRMAYYKDVCESLGLNPLTRPFEYIVLNGKLTLYAKRDCAEQLRKINGVSITSMTPQQIGDLFVVSVQGSDKTGRTDASTGAVNTKGLSGEALANAMMKAETKAKRRLTLSICGLGLLDETEVETVPSAKPFIEPQTFQQQLEGSLAQISHEAPTGTFSVDGDVVTCTVLDVIEKKTQGKSQPYLFVTMNGDIEGQGNLFCYRETLFAAIKFSKEKVARFSFSKSAKGFLSVEHVLQVDGIDPKDLPESEEAIAIMLENSPEAN